MPQIYGSRGACYRCGGKRVKLQCKIGGKTSCMACYSKWRRTDPKKKKRLYAQITAWQKRNRAKVKKYNNAYGRKRYAAIKAAK